MVKQSSLIGDLSDLICGLDEDDVKGIITQEPRSRTFNKKVPFTKKYRCKINLLKKEWI